MNNEKNCRFNLRRIVINRFVKPNFHTTGAAYAQTNTRIIVFCRISLEKYQWINLGGNESYV